MIQHTQLQNQEKNNNKCGGNCCSTTVKKFYHHSSVSINLATQTQSRLLGVKTVTAKFMDNAGLAATAFCAVTLQTIQPSPTATQSPTITPTEEPTTAPTTTPTTQPTQNPTASPEATPKIPELQVGIVLAVFVVLTIALLVIVKRRI